MGTLIRWHSRKAFVRLLIAALLVGILSSPSAPVRAGAVLYAAPGALGSGDCSSWGNACMLQDALASAQDDDEIWVAAGVHKPTALSSDRAAAFALQDSVALYGGFAGVETSRDQRNWETHLTILSGDIDGNDANTDGNFIAEGWNDIAGQNSYHVILSDYMAANAPVVDGFTITAGQADDGNGGGIYNNASHLVLENVHLSGNMAVNYGGAMFNAPYSTVSLANSTFTGNYADLGGGIFNADTDISMTAVTFSNNSATEGGGVFNNHQDYAATITLTEVIFTGNSVSYAGGGMFNFTSHPTLTNVRFDHNTSAGHGGGMVNEVGSNPTLLNVVFASNSAGSFGGGMVNTRSSPTLINALFYANSADHGAGMFSQDHCAPSLTNVTLVQNTSTRVNGGLYNVFFASPILTNSIVWGNLPGNTPQIANTADSIPLISYSDIQGSGGSGAGWDPQLGTDGGGNLDANPVFVNPLAGDLRLWFTSPAIDAGNNTAITVTLDLSGGPRFVDVFTTPDTGLGAPPVVDMGAYEASFGQVHLPILLTTAP